MITWHKHWSLIGQYCSRDTNTDLLLVQALPPDTGDKLASVELQAEKTAADLEDQETEHKKAKNVRYEFQVLYFIMLISLFSRFFGFMMTFKESSYMFKITLSTSRSSWKLK